MAIIRSISHLPAAVRFLPKAGDQRASFDSGCYSDKSEVGAVRWPTSSRHVSESGIQYSPLAVNISNALGYWDTGSPVFMGDESYGRGP
jgi:hypothetical protein